MTSILRPFALRLARRGSLILIGGALALALAIPASASAAAFRAHLRAPNHTPTMNKKWWITVTATRGRAKLSGKVSYRFVTSAGTFSRPGHRFKHGVYRDWLRFPAAAVGHKLILRVVVSTRYGTVGLNWSVTPRK